MLSKFQTKDKAETKKLPRKAIANLLMKEIDEKKKLFSSIERGKAENFLKDRRKKVKWQTNPLYKAKSCSMEGSESESMISLSSQQSYIHSEQSVDNAYKSNFEEENDFQEKKYLKKGTMKTLNAEAEDNAAMIKAFGEENMGQM